MVDVKMPRMELEGKIPRICLFTWKSWYSGDNSPDSDSHNLDVYMIIEKDTLTKSTPLLRIGYYKRGWYLYTTSNYALITEDGDVEVLRYNWTVIAWRYVGDG